MMLLSNEEELLSSNKGKIILTNQRIHMNDKDWGKSYSITIFLEDVSSIELRYNSYILLMILGILAALFCAYSFLTANEYGGNGEDIGRASLIASIVFFVLYWFTRKHIVSITSHGGKALNFEATRLPESDMQKFLRNVQEAKLQRLDLLKNLSGINA